MFFGIRRGLIAFASVLIAAGAPTFTEAQSKKVTRSIAVDKEFTKADIRWDEGTRGYEYRLKVIAADGFLEVCGVGKYLTPHGRDAIWDVLRNAKFTMDGKPILKDLSYFSTIKKNTKFEGAAAKCKRTSAKIPKSTVKFNIDYGKQGYRF